MNTPIPKDLILGINSILLPRWIKYLRTTLTKNIPVTTYGNRTRMRNNLKYYPDGQTLFRRIEEYLIPDKLFHAISYPDCSYLYFVRLYRTVRDPLYHPEKGCAVQYVIKILTASGEYLYWSVPHSQSTVYHLVTPKDIDYHPAYLPNLQKLLKTLLCPMEDLPLLIDDPDEQVLDVVRRRLAAGA